MGLFYWFIIFRRYFAVMYFMKKYKRGILNRYYNGMPWSERLLKDLKVGLKRINFYFNNGFKTKSIFIYPHYPSSGSTIYKIANELNYNLSNKYSNAASSVMYWEYLTHREEYGFLESISDKKLVINLFSRDISKVYVDEQFDHVFGYKTFINPLTYTEKYVVKNDINAKHDGAIFEAPITKKEEGFVYQILIDNTTNDGFVEDIRVPIINGVLDFIYIKHRPIKIRFTNSTSKTKLINTQDVLSQIEIEKINQFCKNIKLQYGELDVLRNKDDQKIYIVDVNNTPQGPPGNMSKLEAKQAITRLSLAFKKEFLN